MASPHEMWGDPRRQAINKEISRLINLKRTKRLSYAKQQEIEKRLNELFKLKPPMPKESLISRFWSYLFG